ncbi:MAG: magnesium transporter CorA family protein [Solirubrobacteraceae bacterium]
MQVLTSLDPDAIASLRSRGEFFWLDLAQPSSDDIARLQELFSLHPLAVEDITEVGQRPKLDDYGDYLLMVFYGARLDEERRPALVEVELVIHGDYIVTCHREPCLELTELHRDLGERPPGSEQFVVYRVVDTLTDTFFPVLSTIDDEIDELENEVISQPTDQQLQRIFRLKRGLVVMRKVISPQRDLFARAGDDIINLPGLEPGTRDYFRDVYDHLIRISDLIDSYRDLLTGAMDVYLSTVSNRLNGIMKQLTTIATIFLPLAFVTGFFGQNFGWMVARVNSLAAFLVLGIGGVLLSGAVLFAYFRRAGFL